MVEIISMSLDSDLLVELDELQKTYKFSGRSETIRSAIRLLASENKTLSQINGSIDACIVIVYPEKSTSKIFQTMHHFQRLVKSQVHYHLGAHKCLEMFVLHGEARDIETITRALKKEKIYNAKLIMLGNPD